MAAAMAANPSISIKKGFLGLTTKIEYKPTKSPVKVITTEFSNDAGSRMRQLPAPCPGAGSVESLFSFYRLLVTFFSYSWITGMNSSPTGTLFLRLK